MTEATMDEMVCGRNILWTNRSVDETSRKPHNNVLGFVFITNTFFIGE